MLNKIFNYYFGNYFYYYIHSSLSDNNAEFNISKMSLQGNKRFAYTFWIYYTYFETLSDIKLINNLDKKIVVLVRQVASAKAEIGNARQRTPHSDDLMFAYCTDLQQRTFIKLSLIFIYYYWKLHDKFSLCL